MKIAAWLADAFPMLAHLGPSDAKSVERLFELCGSTVAQPVLTMDGWREFGYCLASLMLTGSRSEPLSGLLPEIATLSLGGTPLRGNETPEQLARQLGPNAAEGTLATAIAELASLKQPTSDLLREPEMLIEAARKQIVADRDIEIWWMRHVTTRNTTTLQQLAERFGVSRARVQQIEVTTQSKAVRLQARLRRGPLGAAAEQLREALGSAYPINELRWSNVGVEKSAVMSSPHLLGEDFGVVQLGHLLLFLAGRYRIVRNWVVEHGNDLFMATRQAIFEAAVDSLPTPADLDDFLTEAGVLPSVRRRFLQATPDVEVLDGFVCPWPAETAGRAEAVLRVRGEPMSKGDIARFVGRSVGTVGNALAASPTFSRVNIDRYALTVWGATPYEGIVPAMKDVIRGKGGVASAQEIEQGVLDRFTVSPNSIRAYLESPHFVRVNTGQYRIRGASEAPALGQGVSIEDTPTCFRLSEGWAIRLPVNPDRLRGSGVPVPRAFARCIELVPDKDLLLPVLDGRNKSAIASVRFTWPANMPCIGSVSAVLESLQARLGDYLFLEWSDVRSALLAHRLPIELQGEGDLTDTRAVAQRIGFHIGRSDLDRLDVPEVLDALGRSLGLEERAGRSSVLGRLLRRDDDLLVDLARILFDLAAAKLAIAG